MIVRPARVFMRPAPIDLLTSSAARRPRGEAQEAVVPSLRTMLAGIGCLSILVGLILISCGSWHYWIRRGARDEPQRLTLASLLAHGPGTNNHIELIDFAFGGKLEVIPLGVGGHRDQDPQLYVRLVVPTDNQGHTPDKPANSDAIESVYRY